MSALLGYSCYFRLLYTPLPQIDEYRATLMAISILGYEIFSPLMISFGFVTNMLSLATYIRMGFTDGITISFFALTLADACRAIPALFTWLTELLTAVACTLPKLTPLQSLTGYCAEMFFDISVLTTIYILVQRCACVTFPLQVRGVFTKFRVTCVIAGIYILVFTWYIPLFAQQRLVIRADSVLNITQFIFIYTKELHKMTSINYTVHIAVSVIAQVINLICLAIFTKALIASSRFRLQSSSLLPQGVNLLESSGATTTYTKPPFLHCSRLNEVSRNIPRQADSEKQQTYANNLVKKHRNNYSPRNKQITTQRKQKNINSKGTRTPGYSSKETQIIKVVTLTSAIFVCSNFPTTCVSITYLVVPEFRSSPKHYLGYAVTTAIKNFCQYLNTDLSFFVYLTCNSKFKETFYSYFNSRCCQSSHRRQIN